MVVLFFYLERFFVFVRSNLGWAVKLRPIVIVSLNFSYQPDHIGAGNGAFH